MMKKRIIGCLLALIIIAAVAGYFWREKRGGPTGPTPDEMVKLLLEFDQNADGKLTSQNACRDYLNAATQIKTAC